MKTIKVLLKNCYGIKELDYTFDFSKCSTYAIYAPNGTMKTSFAKTFLDASKDEESRDSIFQERETSREITDIDGNTVLPENLFVVLPYDRDFRSEKMSTLLVNNDLRKLHEQIHENINQHKESLIKSLKPLSGLKSTIEETVSRDFVHTEKDFFKAIMRVQVEVLDETPPLFDKIQYSQIFNDKVVKFLAQKDVKVSLAEYIKTYDKLIESSTFFQKGIFNHNNATTIAKNLKDNGFFRAKHSVSLNGKEIRQTITTEQELEKVIQDEKTSILENEDLRKAFDDIDKKITGNQELRDFRNFLENNPTIISELHNLELLKQNLWVSYLKVHREVYKELVNEYSKGLKEIEEIVNAAKKESTRWSHVIDEFNRRFHVPFKLSVDNQEDVILNRDAPNIKFTFIDAEESTQIKEDELFKVLSQGELRALYILNIIFEVQARKESRTPSLFVIDDIADSFDNKNKYAIIEYLHDISKDPLFNQILLSHNFDFYRTVGGRLNLKRTHRLYTNKSNSAVTLIEEKYQNNPFDYWRRHFHLNGREKELIASIPFVRNIAEFTGYKDHYRTLTSLLHLKDETSKLKVSDLQKIFKEILIDKKDIVFESPEKKVIDLIYETADEIRNGSDESIELEGKIVLAIAIRLKTERFMISKISDADFLKQIRSNQTCELINKYKEAFPGDDETIEILEQVNLMTPENIHLNSFMYEPILDMSNHHLLRLYSKISELNRNNFT